MESSWNLARLLMATMLACGSPAEAAEPSEPERIVVLNQYLSSVAERRWTDALLPAQRLVDIAKSDDARPREMADALTRLGGVQLALKDYPNAEISFGSAITVQEKQSGPLDKGLEEPLAGLGYTLASMGKHADAVQILERALLVSQRQNGLFDQSQLGLRQQLGNSLAELGRGLEAEQQFRYILQIAESAYGPQDIRMAEAQDLVGDWYSRWGHFEAARQLYRRAILLIETKAGASDPRLINPLRSLGRSYIRELLFTNAGVVTGAYRPLRRTRLPAEGEEAILRAVRIMDTEPPSALVYRTSLVDAGDWFLLKDDGPRALEFYGRALGLPAVTNEEAALVGDPLSSPAMLDYELPPAARRYLDRPTDKTVERRVVLEFTVVSSGEVLSPQVVESDATERMERETVAALSEALYRPRFENGVPVDTPNVRFQQTFKELKN